MHHKAQLNYKCNQTIQDVFTEQFILDYSYVNETNPN